MEIVLTWWFFVLVMFCLIEAVTLNQWNTSKKIVENGVAGVGILVSCKRINILQNYWFYPQYEPIIRFYLEEKCYEVSAIGIFHSRIKPIGKKVEIIFWNEYPEHVVIKGSNFKKMYILSMLFYFIVHLSCIVIIWFLGM